MAKSPEQKEFDIQVDALKALGFTVMENTFSKYRGFYSGSSYYAYKEKHKIKSDWGNFSYDVYKGKFGFETGGSSYCCGQMEIGRYYAGLGEFEDGEEEWGSDDDGSLSKIPTEAWVCLFKMMQLVEKENGFAQTATLATKDYSTIEKALRQCGFRKIKTVASKHSSGKYNINIWQWISKKEKK